MKSARYINESKFGLFKSTSELSTPKNDHHSNNAISYWELAKRTCPALLTGIATLFIEVYWPLLVTSQALPPLGAALLITTGIALILYGVYQGAKYMSDLQNKPDYEEDVTLIDPPIVSCWDKFMRL